MVTSCSLGLGSLGQNMDKINECTYGVLCNMTEQVSDWSVFAQDLNKTACNLPVHSPRLKSVSSSSTS